MWSEADITTRHTKITNGRGIESVSRKDAKTQRGDGQHGGVGVSPADWRRGDILAQRC
jgi:hypothetical protein